MYLEKALHVRRYFLDPAGSDMLRGISALVQMTQVWQNAGPVLTRAEMNAACGHYSIFLGISARLGAALIPKRHQVCHLLQQQGRFGNPVRFASWHDESLNRKLKAACRLQGQATFEIGVLLRMRSLLSQGERKRLQGS